MDSGRFREALALYFASAEAGEIATPGSRLLAAEAAARIGEFEVSARLARGARSSFESVGDTDGVLDCSNLLGAIAFDRGRIREAETCFLAVDELAGTRHRSRYAARSANNLGGIASLRGDVSRAILLYGKALATYEELGDPGGIAEASHNIALAYAEAGNVAAAHLASSRSVVGAEALGNPGLLALALLGRAELRIRSSALDEAAEDIHRAALLAWAEGTEPQRLEAERLGATICFIRGDAAEAHRRAMIVFTRAAEAQLGVLAAEARTLVALTLKAQGRHTEAVAARESATVALRSLGAASRLARFEQEWTSI